MQYATQVLRSNIMVAAIENVFVPVFIRNSNGAAHDKAILKEFKEPAWNYPVARFINAERGNIIPRLPDVWKNKKPVALVAEKMLAAIAAGKYEVADEALGMLKDAKAGKKWSDEEVKEVVEALDGKIGRKLDKSLDSAVKAYEKHAFAKAREAALKVQKDEKAEDRAKKDAAWVVEKIDGKFGAFKAKLEEAKKAREFLALYQAYDKRAKHFKGLDGYDAWAKSMAALKKEKATKLELKGQEKLEKLAEKLAEANGEKDEKKRLKAVEKAKKDLLALAKKYPDTLTAEKATALAKQ